jgi:hypothetical protein
LAKISSPKWHLTTQSRGPPWKHGIQASYHPARRSLILVVRTQLDNPYRHPDSELPSALAQPMRPNSLRVAASFFAFSIILSSIDIVISWYSEPWIIESVLVLLLMYSFVLTCFYFIWSGYNWARICYLLYSALVTFLELALVIRDDSLSSTDGIFALIVTILNIFTWYFLLKKDYSHWVLALKSYRLNGF